MEQPVSGVMMVLGPLGFREHQPAAGVCVPVCGVVLAELAVQAAKLKSLLD